MFQCSADQSQRAKPRGHRTLRNQEPDRTELTVCGNEFKINDFHTYLQYLYQIFLEPCPALRQTRDCTTVYSIVTEQKEDEKLYWYFIRFS